MKLKSILFIIIFSLLPPFLLATSSSSRPKLVVGIMVDQMRWDYLYRYANRYSSKGFKRLLNKGFSSENTIIDHMPTYTAIGHSTVYTGSVPAIHGITGNDFIIEENGKNVYCTEDNTVVGIGVAGKVGKQSPKNLLVSTVTDELKLATNFKSKVIGISIKDRGGILPAGRFADAAYWFDGESGSWVSSSYYMNKLPSWVVDFNNKKYPAKYLEKEWNTLYPVKTYVKSTKDDSYLYEESFKGEEKPVFPRNLSKLKDKDNYDLIKNTPYGNTFTFDFVKATIDAENLGNNPSGVTDFLAISLSSTDYVGHQFGINSIEIEDTYLRLDRDLADFLSYLDKKVGKGNYTLFLTADHGAAHNPRLYADNKGNAGYFDIKKVQGELNKKLEKVFGQKNIIHSLINYQVHLNNSLIKSKGLKEESIKNYIIKELEKIPGVAFVVDAKRLELATLPSIIKERIANSYNSKRSGVIWYILESQWYSEGTLKGTTHGTWWSYDSHIPVIFMGFGVKPGKTLRKVHMTDIAPTISQILKIEFPNGNIGNPIYEAIDSK